MNQEAEPVLLKRRLRRSGIVAALCAFAIAAVGIALRLHAQTEVKRLTEEQAIPTVAIVAPKAGAAAEELVLPGTLRAYFDAPIYARVGGYLKRWYVDIGATVHAGQPLAEIETPELDQQIRQAEADLATARANDDLARTTAARWQNMLGSESVSKQEADEKAGDYAARTAALAAAQANLERLRQIASFKRIVAPFDGIVTARNTDTGALINAGAGSGQELFRVADEHAVRVYVDAPQTYAAQVHIGMTAQLLLPEKPGLKITAKVADLAQALRESSRTMQVELMADNFDGALLPGEYVEVHFEIAAQTGVFELPTTALLFRQEGLEVATVDSGNHVVLKPIQLLRERGSVVDVSSGISAVDQVVDSPPDSIESGDTVRLQDAATGTAAKVAKS
ncbi:MAG: efflux RND transporter periplasmic adaptor subunit [Steroidobacterales bacterium]